MQFSKLPNANAQTNNPVIFYIRIQLIAIKLKDAESRLKVLFFKNWDCWGKGSGENSKRNHLKFVLLLSPAR
jgi:hypothetical protein